MLNLDRSKRVRKCVYLLHCLSRNHLILSELALTPPSPSPLSSSLVLISLIWCSSVAVGGLPCLAAAFSNIYIQYFYTFWILNPTHSNPREALEKIASPFPDYSLTSQVYIIRLSDLSLRLSKKLDPIRSP